MRNNISKTSKSLLNAKVSFIFYVANLVLQFYSRKIFLDYLGSEILGLNATMQNIIGFLNLAELGIGSAIAYHLYKPLYHKNYNEINDIISIQGWLYKKIAIIIISLSILLLPFLPKIFSKTDISLLYIYGSFIALLTSALLSYFINYKQILLSADQKEYKIIKNVQGFKFIKVCTQTLAIIFIAQGYLAWILLEIIFAFLTSFFLNNTIAKEYPLLNVSSKLGKLKYKEYPVIITKTKQIFFHRIAAFVLTQTSPLIIYSYASLTLVAIYTNYMLIVTGLTQLTNGLMNSINAGIGSLIAEGNKEKIIKTFWDLTLLRIWIASIICFTFYCISNKFIILWVGENYLLETTPVLLITIILFISLTRTNDYFIAGYGLYQDVWASGTEAILNLALSIILGKVWGLTGTLSGILTSLVIIILIWKPFFLFKFGFKINFINYITKYTKFIVLMSIAGLLSKILDNYLNTKICNNYEELIQYTLLILIEYSVISFIILLLLEKNTYSLIVRFKQILKL